MTDSAAKLGITELVLRDAHQSLFATRMRLEDMLPIASELDAIGFWSMESWGGATFDACIRYLGEDPWERIRELKKAMPNTPQQMGPIVTPAASAPATPATAQKAPSRCSAESERRRLPPAQP